jgi:hypothetical protein
MFAHPWRRHVRVCSGGVGGDKAIIDLIHLIRSHVRFNTANTRPSAVTDPRNVAIELQYMRAT